MVVLVVVVVDVERLSSVVGLLEYNDDEEDEKQQLGPTFLAGGLRLVPACLGETAGETTTAAVKGFARSNLRRKLAGDKREHDDSAATRMEEAILRPQRLCRIVDNNK